MEFKLNFTCDNAAFTDMPEAEIARILRQVADRVENGTRDGRVVDYNGNSVGSFELSEKEN